VEIAAGIRRLGPGLANVYLFEEGGAVTIVDAGVPGYWRALPAELAAMGRTLEDVRAVVLTHAHTDHIGFAERIRTERGVPIRVHELDALRAKGKVPGPKGLGRFKLVPLLGFLVFGLRNGLLRAPPILEVSTFGDGATLDVPGSPRVIHVPGHTEGSAALHFARRDAVCVGDAFVTRNVITRHDRTAAVPELRYRQRAGLRFARAVRRSRRATRPRRPRRRMGPRPRRGGTARARARTRASVSEACASCGLVTAGGAEGCQRLFEAIGLREYEDMRFARYHRIVVDAYAMQHPERYGRSAKSFAAHLTGLCAWLQNEAEAQTVNAAVQRWLNGPSPIEKPSLPESYGDVTIREIVDADDPVRYGDALRRWT